MNVGSVYPYLVQDRSINGVNTIMFIIEYWRAGQFHKMAPMDGPEAMAIERLLLSLDAVSLVMVWGPI